MTAGGTPPGGCGGRLVAGAAAEHADRGVRSVGTPRRWRIGTRRSALALAQAEWVAAWLRASGQGAVELVTLVTAGDRLQAQPPVAAVAGGRGIFVQELEAALLEGRVDLCVHSAKDVPPELAEGLALVAFPRRADPRDALVAPAGWTVAGMPQGARVGTGSPRRALQLREMRPDVVLVPLRGNVDTRLRRQAAGDYDALVLAAAGLERLGFLNKASELISPEIMLPAAGQGALAIEARAGDAAVRRALSALDDGPTRAAVLAERAVLAALGGGCSAPAGALAVFAEGRLALHAVLAGAASGRVRRCALDTAWPDGTVAGDDAWALAQGLGGRVAAALLADGGEALLREAADTADGAGGAAVGRGGGGQATGDVAAAPRG